MIMKTTAAQRSVMPFVTSLVALLLCIGVVAVALFAHAKPAAGARTQAAPHMALMAAGQASTGTTTPPAPVVGTPTARITAPVDGTTYATGAAVTVTATLSTDPVTALQAGSARSCTFSIGDDAGSTANGTFNLTAGTCTGSWTYSYAGSFAITASIVTPSQITYGTAPINVTITGSTNPRCTGAGAPATCVYRWTEVYYNSADTRFARVCSIDGGCLWQIAHTVWPQITSDDYWVKSTGQVLPDGNLAEAYLCVGSSPASWSSYASTHNFDALTSQPDTSAKPLPSGTC
jgi:hypothetical protein